MDISDTLAPKSDQLDGIDLVHGPRTFTIDSVTRGNADQPVNVHLAEFPRPWRPGKNMRRVLAYCWGQDASLWVGRRVTLFYDPDVSFGKETPGGTRISHLSDIAEPMSAPIVLTRGKSGKYRVDPLPDAPAPDPRIEALQNEWRAADPDRRKEIEAEVANLRGGQ
jgi:hypothetical protein